MFDLSVIIRLIRMRFSVGVFGIFTIWFSGNDDISFYAALVTNRFLWAKTHESKISDSHARTREPFAPTEYYLQSEPLITSIASLFQEFYLKIFIVIPCESIFLHSAPFFRGPLPWFEEERGVLSVCIWERRFPIRSESLTKSKVRKRFFFW